MQGAIDILNSMQEKLCVLSSVDSTNSPESAVMAFAVSKSGKILLSTNKNTRKVANIRNGTRVALVFGWNFTEKNIQMEGDAELIETGDEFTKTNDIYFSQNSAVLAFKTPETIFISVTPRWARVTDLSAHPPTIEEYSA